MDRSSELIQQIRHYSTLRFAIFAAFLAVTAGLFTMFAAAASWAPKLFIAGAGILFTLAFLYLQNKLSANYHDCLQLLLETEKDGEVFVKTLFGLVRPSALAGHLARGRQWVLEAAGRKHKQAELEYLGPVTAATLGLHVLVIVLWAVLLFL